jgi:ribosomal protein S18 acetylase RimI-like enzyme
VKRKASPSWIALRFTFYVSRTRLYASSVQIRSLAPDDLAALPDIDGTVESSEYLHLEQSGEGLSVAWKIEKRPLRQKLIQTNPISDEEAFLVRQIAGGTEEGLALIVEHAGAPVALLVVRPDYANGTFQILDIRIDYDHRRQGLATAMIYQAINRARELGLRAVSAEVPANNLPGNQLLLKCAFDLSGIDTKRHSNHDVVKESATLIWYAALD